MWSWKTVLFLNSRGYVEFLLNDLKLLNFFVEVDLLVVFLFQLVVGLAKRSGYKTVSVLRTLLGNGFKLGSLKQDIHLRIFNLFLLLFMQGDIFAMKKWKRFLFQLRLVKTFLLKWFSILFLLYSHEVHSFIVVAHKLLNLLDNWIHFSLELCFLLLVKALIGLYAYVLRLIHLHCLNVGCSWDFELFPECIGQQNLYDVSDEARQHAFMELDKLFD